MGFVEGRSFGERVGLEEGGKDGELEGIAVKEEGEVEGDKEGETIG